MSAATKYVLLFEAPASGTVLPVARSVEGVYVRLEHALGYAQELVATNGLHLAGFTVEGFKGRDFVGAWDVEGKLIERRERTTETAEEPQ